MKTLALLLCFATSAIAAPTVSVTVNWTATYGDGYTIYYGKNNPPLKQVDGGMALRNGAMSVTIGGIESGTTYYFSRITTHYSDTDCCDQTQSAPTPMKAYFVSSAANQSITVP